MTPAGDLDVNWLTLAPPITLLVTASVALIAALFLRSSKPIAWLSLAGLFITALFTSRLHQEVQVEPVLSSFGLRYLADGPAIAFIVVILLGATLAVMLSYDYLRRTGLEHPEYYPLMLLSACGAVVLASAGDLVTLILGLEIMSLPVYVLSAWRQKSRESEEAGLKYFLMGAFATAILIYGTALVYGATGHFTFDAISAALFAEDFDQHLLATLGGMLVLAGLAFKVALAPFHQWAPDVYTGAPNPVVAFMSVVVKAAAFAALLRMFAVVYPDLSEHVYVVLAVLIAVTLVIANASALAQRGVKRMLGYSAVAHAGYLGLAVLAADTVGVQAAGFYLFAYAFMNIGAFAVLTLISDASDHGDDIDRFAGLASTRPFLAAAMAVFMLSLAGIPLTAGFIGKVMVFQAAIAAGYVVLTVLAILTSVIAVWYYFRVVGSMYFQEPEYKLPSRHDPLASAVVAIAALGTLLFGILPGWWISVLWVGG